MINEHETSLPHTINHTHFILLDNLFTCKKGIIKKKKKSRKDMKRLKKVGHEECSQQTIYWPCGAENCKKICELKNKLMKFLSGCIKFLINN